MSLTVDQKKVISLGNRRMTISQVDFDSSYPAGGEELDYTEYGFKDVDSINIRPHAGYTFEYDYSNKKIKAFCPAPPIVYEEKHTIASNAITLDYPAAAILQIASASQSQMLIEPSDTPAANECKLSSAMEWGVRPSITFHASTSGAITVTYITQAWKEVWDNRVASADFETATHVADLEDTICFIESCCAYDTSAAVVNSLNQFVRGGDAADAGECEVDFSDSGAGTAGDTTLTFNASDAVTDIKLTYIKLPTSGFLKNRFLEDQDTTMSSGAGSSGYPILFQAFCNQIPDYTAAGERDPHYLMMAEGDALGTAQEWAIDWHKLITDSGTPINLNDSTSDAVSLSYVYGIPSEIPGVVPLEVRNGTDLSDLTDIRIEIIGL
jgi:hypothetical protein